MFTLLLVVLTNIARDSLVERDKVAKKLVKQQFSDSVLLSSTLLLLCLVVVVVVVEYFRSVFTSCYELKDVLKKLLCVRPRLILLFKQYQLFRTIYTSLI